ncbi:Oxoglutarate/iron-dependent dioxygenase [Burkholderiales bacterium]
MIEALKENGSSAKCVRLDNNGESWINLSRASFRYEPYPIGIIPKIFEPSLYDRLVEAFPPVDIFHFMHQHGDKWSLSEVNNSDLYHRFINSNADWGRLYREVKSTGFIKQVLASLLRSKIDLGLTATSNVGALSKLRNKLLGRHSSNGLRARFEFSMMRSDGGHILPHTDSPQKHITLVVSMVRKDEWNPSWGGGTDLMRPINPSDNFNLMNRYLGFEDVETIETMPYEPNQCVIFIKTFNSLHAVRPMTGPREVMRRTLTINIETA